MSDDLRHRHLVEAARLQEGHRVLEIGSGHGVTLGLIVTTVGSGQVWAVDQVGEDDRGGHAAQPGARGRRPAAPAVRQVQDCVFDDNAFDRVVAMRVREIWDDARTVLPALGRWLRPDGLLCLGIDAPHRAGVEEECRRATEQLAFHGYRSIGVAWDGDPRLAAVTAGPPRADAQSRASASAGTS